MSRTTDLFCLGLAAALLNLGPGNARAGVLSSVSVFDPAGQALSSRPAETLAQAVQARAGELPPDLALAPQDTAVHLGGLATADPASGAMGLQASSTLHPDHRQGVHTRVVAQGAFSDTFTLTGAGSAVASYAFKAWVRAPQDLYAPETRFSFLLELMQAGAPFDRDVVSQNINCRATVFGPRCSDHPTGDPGQGFAQVALSEPWYQIERSGQIEVPEGRYRLSASTFAEAFSGGEVRVLGLDVDFQPAVGMTLQSDTGGFFLPTTVVAQVPEPGNGALVALALGLLAVVGRRGRLGRPGRHLSWRLRSGLALAALFAQAGQAATVDLATGSPGTLLRNQSFNETRGISATVLGSTPLQLSAMRLNRLDILQAPGGMLGARVYDDVVGTALAWSDVPVPNGQDQSVMLPISLLLMPGSSYRFAFFVDNAGFGGSADGFVPDTPTLFDFAYVEPSGHFRITGAWSTPEDAFPTGRNMMLPLVSLQVQPAAAVPEPATGAMLLAGVLLIGRLRRRLGLTGS